MVSPSRPLAKTNMDTSKERQVACWIERSDRRPSVQLVVFAVLGSMVTQSFYTVMISPVCKGNFLHGFTGVRRTVSNDPSGPLQGYLEATALNTYA